MDWKNGETMETWNGQTRIERAEHVMTVYEYGNSEDAD